MATNVNKELRIKRMLTAGLMFLLIVSVLFMLNGWAGGHFSSVESLRDYLNQFGALGPLVLTLIQALQVVLPVLPGWLGCIVGAMLFGAVGGFLINYIGISAGSVAAYWLARKYGVRLVKHMIPMDRYTGLTEWVNSKKSYTVILFLAILLPLAPDDFFCYFSGLTGMDSRKYTWIIIIAKPWCILFYSLFFSYVFN